MADTIFERYGGFSAVRRIVSDFYDRVLDSPVIAHHFEKVDMKRLLDHQARFIAAVTGGPASYSDEHLRRITSASASPRLSSARCSRSSRRH